MGRGKIYIIPNDDILADYFIEDVNNSHLDAIINFSKKYKLGYEFDAADYNKAPSVLALNGHLVVKTEDDANLAVFYLPDVITDRQIMFLYQQKNLFAKYATVGAYSFDNSDNFENYEEIYGIDNILKKASNKNLFYTKKDGENNARKKI